PFIEAPNIRVGLIVSTEVRIIQSVFIEKLIGRGGLDDVGAEGIRDGVCLGSDTARSIGHPAIVTNSSAGVQDRVEDVSLLITCRAVGGGMVTVTSQDVIRAALERRSVLGIGRSCAGWVKEKVPRGRSVQVAWNVPVLAFAFIRKAAVHARIVNLLR